jgi:hypothetical protein
LNILGCRTYDPAIAVSKATTAALAMTALDTTNLRLAFSVPAHGMVRIRMAGVVHGATTYPSILLGVLEGATVRGRVSPVGALKNTAVATAMVSQVADFIVTGLTPGPVTWDAAYGVETAVAATGLKYGGPNNTVANDAFGAFSFEVWDPAPSAGGDPWATQLPGAYAAGTAGKILGDRIMASVTGSVGSVSGLNAAHLDAAISSRLAAAGYTAPDNAGIASIKAKTDANLDVAVSSRSVFAGGAVASVTAPVSITGDLSLAMKASVTIAATLATPTVTVQVEPVGAAAPEAIAAAVWDASLKGMRVQDSVGARLRQWFGIK